MVLTIARIVGSHIMLRTNCRSILILSEAKREAGFFSWGDAELPKV